MANLILILGDQLSQAISALDEADKASDLVVLAEVQDEASYTNHHKKKLAFIFSAMRHFARQLETDGWQVHYQAYHPENADQTLEQVVARLALQHKPNRLITTECGEWRLHEQISQWSGKPAAPGPFRVEPDEITQAVIELVDEHFPHHFGTTRDFHYAVTPEQAQHALDYFIDFALPCFGDYQDALSDQEDWLFHSILSPYLNTGLLDPLAVCEAVAQAWYSGRAPLNAVEGFIRQIIGWREFVRGIYWLHMPGYAQENRLGNTRALPWFYWTGKTRMRCLHKAIDATARNAYAHHIQRLMVTGNFALLAGVKPEEICDWYLAVYIDAFDWVELPNTLGMVMHADGGYLGSKPYAASGKYIQRMSDHCQNCHYRVQDATGDRACPFNSLYWYFIDRHREAFSGNPRMTMMYRNWERQAPERRKAILARADQLLDNLEQL